MKFTKLLTNYVSEIDQFLEEFDRRNPQKSASQQYEIAKAQRIYYLRDKTDRSEEKKLPDWF